MSEMNFDKRASKIARSGIRASMSLKNERINAW
jgi:hypothetical protein